ncbi:MAG: hypothetical protein Q4B75_09785 [Eubacteriales bacterium]|nr:hypothetical protein [Eubacteriales bacterium]
MTFPKLTLPPKDYSLRQAYADKERAGSFASWFDTAVIRFRADDYIHYGVYEDSSDMAKKRKACEAVNKSYNDMRRCIDQHVQEAILNHDGVIDSWCDSCDDTINEAEGCLFAFDYFGEDYTITGSGTAARKSNALIYRNEYVYHNTEAYEKFQKEKDHLKNEYQLAKQAGDAGGIAFLSLVCLIYMIFQVVLIVGDLLFHLGSAIYDPLYELWGSVAMLLNTPYTIYVIIADTQAESTKFMVIFLAILLGACLIAILYLFVVYMNCRENAQKRRRAKRALNALVNSAEYRQVVAENEKLRKLNEEMAETWHRAWFNWVRSIKYAAKVPVDKKVEKEFMGNLKKNVDKADFAELINRKKKS